MVSSLTRLMWDMKSLEIALMWDTKPKELVRSNNIREKIKYHGTTLVTFLE
jgi:hypothetical protein